MVESHVMPAVERLSHLEMQSGSSDFHDIDMDAYNDMNLDDADAMLVDEKVGTKPLVVNKEEEEDKAPAWLTMYDSLAAPEDVLGPLDSSASSASMHSGSGGVEMKRASQVCRGSSKTVAGARGRQRSHKTAAQRRGEGVGAGACGIDEELG
jgi:hypothetical protein